jgi:uncharacterized alkaline shock family protein YloU
MSTPTSTAVEKKSEDKTPAKDSALATEHGKITVDDSVVTKVAGLAAREVSGVHAMGAGSARAFGALKQRIPGSSSSNTVSQGVSVEVGETEAAIDLDIVIEYGVSIAVLGRSIQHNVKQSVERITGLKVVEVNVNVDDVYLGEDSDDSSESRVQ